MNLFAISGLINAISVFVLGGIVYFKNRKKEINIRYALFCFFVGLWSFCYFFWQISQDKNSALLWSRCLMAGVIFIPICFFHFVLLLLDLYEKRKRIISIGYLIFLLFFALNFTPWFVSDVKPKMFFKFWPEPGPVFGIFLLVWFWYCLYPCYLLIRDYGKFTGVKRQQIKYVLIGILIGYGSGSTNYFLWYNIPIPPYGNFIVPLFVAMMAYAVIRHRLMDITILAVRTLIFSIVYGVFLILPLFTFFGSKSILAKILLGPNWWLLPMSVAIYAMLVLLAPFIYLFFQRRAEAMLLKNQRRYQETLRKLSATLTLVKDLYRLLKLVVLRVSRAVKVDFACVYLTEKDTKLIQKYPYTIKGFFPDFPKELSFDSSLVRYITSKRKPIFAEEVSTLGDSFNLKTGLIVPSFVRKRLLGFLVLGPKSSGTIYNEADANMFGILANQLALAIENSQFIDEHERTQAELFSRERMASLGTMAGGMTHQINNRFNAISMATSDTIDTLKFIDLEKATKEELKDYLNQIAHALNRIQENALRGGKLVNDFLNFSQPDRLQKEAKLFNLPEPLERGIEMVRIKSAFVEDTIQKEIPESPLLIRGSFEMIQDMFFNLTDNAIDALDKKDKAIKNKELPEPEGGYKGKVGIRMYTEEPWVVTKIQDNGIGMTKEQTEKLFTPFFTTKATAIKGTGLGLFVIYKIIEAHGGTIEVESEYGKGTTFSIKLPLAKEEEENNEP